MRRNCLFHTVLQSFFLLQENRYWNELCFLFDIHVSIWFFITELNFFAHLSWSLSIFRRTELKLVHFTINFQYMIMSNVIYKIVYVIIYNGYIVTPLYFFTAKICCCAVTKTVLFCISLSPEICTLIIFTDITS